MSEERNKKIIRQIKTQKWIFVVSCMVIIIGAIMLMQGDYDGFFLKKHISGRALSRNPFSVFFLLALVMLFLSAKNISKLRNKLEKRK